MSLENKIINLLCRRSVFQLTQGLIVGGMSRTLGDFGATPIMYGTVKYWINKAGKGAELYPFEKHSAIKKTAWYALGAALPYADVIYATAQNIIEKI